MNPLKQLETLGQSVWYDNVSRQLVRSGQLAALVDDGVMGVTSNPSIFEKAIGQSNQYDEEIRKMARGNDAATVFRKLAVEDIRDACDVLRPLYDRQDGRDGYVSIEVSPYLADDLPGTVDEARSLWTEIARPNLMIKVPATRAGVSAVRTLISEGINVNVTLLFACAMYGEVAEAYLSGLEARSGNLSRIASVASFFISRIDSKADVQIAEKLKASQGADRGRLDALKGKTAIANAKLAYARYEQIFSGARWNKLVERGARAQRLLWASTGTKDKSYSDVLYVEELIGPNTVNTMPPETLAAYRDHGKPASRIQSGLAEAKADLTALEDFGISLDRITSELLIAGVKQFRDAADTLFAAIETKRRNVAS
ncbi:MAG: transaldolase [Rhizomicrobium sp.]|jgi:transaldolase/glucose-6-phosphate isomerase